MKYLILPLFLALAGCGLFGEPDRTMLAEGTVVLAETGEPLPDIVVQIRGSGGVFPIFAADTSDAQGHFRTFDEYATLRRGYRLRAVDVRLLEPGPDPEIFTVSSMSLFQNNDDIEVGEALRNLRIEMELRRRD